MLGTGERISELIHNILLPSLRKQYPLLQGEAKLYVPVVIIITLVVSQDSPQGRETVFWGEFIGQWIYLIFSHIRCVFI